MTDSGVMLWVDCVWTISLVILSWRQLEIGRESRFGCGFLACSGWLPSSWCTWVIVDVCSSDESAASLLPVANRGGGVEEDILCVCVCVCVCVCSGD